MNDQERWREMVQTIPSCVACGLLKISEGEIIDQYSRNHHFDKNTKLVALAAGELFESSSVAAKHFAEIVTSQTGTIELILSDEICLSLEHSSHLVIRDKNSSDHAIFFTFSREDGLAIALNKARLQMKFF